MGILNNLLKSADEEKKEEVIAGTTEKVVSSPAPKKAKKVAVTDSSTKETIVSSRSNKKEPDATAYKIISHPLISEKATDMAQFNKYVFAVPSRVNKSEIKEKIFSIYGVKPVKINILYKEGKRVRHGRQIGKKKNFKKAIITLAPGQKIEVYEGV
jgi:large subunit ribosomal protein L23